MLGPVYLLLKYPSSRLKKTCWDVVLAEKWTWCYNFVCTPGMNTRSLHSGNGNVRDGSPGNWLPRCWFTRLSSSSGQPRSRGPIRVWFTELSPFTIHVSLVGFSIYTIPLHTSRFNAFSHWKKNKNQKSWRYNLNHCVLERSYIVLF